MKFWNGGAGVSMYDIPGLTNYASTVGTGHGAINIDANYGSANTTKIVAITSAAQGGYHPAARYCDKLSYGGYTDWYLPNRYELNLMFINNASIPGLFSSDYYWSSTEYDDGEAWVLRPSDGYQNQSVLGKSFNFRIRCVRRF